MRLFLCVLLVAVLVPGCYYDNEEDLYPGSFCDTSDVTWTNTIQPMILSNCAQPGCHVAGGNGTGDFTTYEGVIAQVNNDSILRIVTLENKSMPPGAPLTKCERQQLEIWLDAQAPEN